jgi:hypothetical protein
MNHEIVHVVIKSQHQRVYRLLSDLQLADEYTIMLCSISDPFVKT